jgi:hypothetical protein
MMDALRRIFSRSGATDVASTVDAPGSSLLAIARRRAAIGGELSAHIYRYADSTFIVTSIMSVPGSIVLETGEPTVLPFEAADADLGRIVCRHLLEHDARRPPNLRDHKTTDWSAFQASGDSSVSGFEGKSSRVTVETINLVLNIEAAPVRSLHAEISVKGVAQPLHNELGATIRRTLMAADALRQAGIV